MRKLSVIICLYLAAVTSRVEAQQSFIQRAVAHDEAEEHAMREPANPDPTARAVAGLLAVYPLMLERDEREQLYARRRDAHAFGLALARIVQQHRAAWLQAYQGANAQVLALANEDERLRAAGFGPSPRLVTALYSAWQLRELARKMVTELTTAQAAVQSVLQAPVGAAHR